MRYLLVAACVVASYGDAGPIGPQELYRQAETRRRQWELNSASRLASRGLKGWSARSAPEWYWRFRLLKAEILLERGETKAALPLLTGDAPTAELRARLEMNLATASFRQSKLAEAGLHYDQARALATGDLAAEIDIKRSYLLAMRRQFGEAEKVLTGAIHSLGGRDPYLEAYAQINLGFSRMRQGHLEEAVTAYERARDLSTGKGGSRRAAVLALGNLGSCYFRLGDFDRSLALLSEAVSLGGQIGDKLDAKGYLGDIGNVHFRQGNYREAIRYYRQSEALADELNDTVWTAKMLNNMAEASIRLGDADAARAYSQRAIELKERNADPGSLAYAMLNAAHIELDEGHLDAAEARIHEAAELAETSGDPAIQWAVYGGLAAVYRAAGRPAEPYYRRAIQVIDQEWARLSQDQSKVTFLAQLIRFYQDYVDFLVERGESERALAVAESSRARALGQRLNKPEAAADFDPHALLRLSARSRTVFLSYWVAPQRSFVWVIGPQRIVCHALPGESEIAGRVDTYSESILGGSDPLETGNPAGAWLYDKLLAKASAAIPQGWDVLVVPDGCLYRLNLETLPAGRGYWVEQAAVSVAPSLSVLEPEVRGTAKGVLVIGDPEPTRGFGKLAGAGVEIGGILRAYPGAEVIRGAAATPVAYQAAGPQHFNTIHFAAHATANRESPLDSAVVLSPVGGNARLYARDVLALPLSADLVTISACRSAGARTYSGEGLMGFSWAFLHAGARHVVAGLWDADDSATAKLMARFYAERAEGRPVPDALRLAKLELLASPETRAPYYWGAFQVFSRAVGAAPGGPRPSVAANRGR